MYMFIKEGISHTDDALIARQVSPRATASYCFTRLQYPNIFIPNRGLAWALEFKPEDSEEKIKIKNDVESYNQYLDALESIPNFKSYFIDHELCVSRDEVSDRWSTQIAEQVFSKVSHEFFTDLCIINGKLIDVSIPAHYSVRLNGKEISFPIGKRGEDYPARIEKRRIIWNWTDNGHDFCFGIWELLGEQVSKNGDNFNEEEGVTYCFDAYDQFRKEPAEPQLVRIFEKLEKLGYIQTFTVKPESPNPLWNFYCKSDGTLDCAVVDMAFLKNKLIMEQINLLLWSTPSEIEEAPYFVTDEHNKQNLSHVPGLLGGHNRLKIYGRLDCPSALRFIAKGQYVQHRVFFSDEKTAINAGYRPCARCMPEEYKLWKQHQNKLERDE